MENNVMKNNILELKILMLVIFIGVNGIVSNCQAKNQKLFDTIPGVNAEGYDITLPRQENDFGAAQWIYTTEGPNKEKKFPTTLTLRVNNGELADFDYLGNDGKGSSYSVRLNDGTIWRYDGKSATPTNYKHIDVAQLKAPDGKVLYLYNCKEQYRRNPLQFAAQNTGNVPDNTTSTNGAYDRIQSNQTNAGNNANTPSTKTTSTKPAPEEVLGKAIVTNTNGLIFIKIEGGTYTGDSIKVVRMKGMESMKGNTGLFINPKLNKDNTYTMYNVLDEKGTYAKSNVPKAQAARFLPSYH